jgi:hypothetical protein
MTRRSLLLAALAAFAFVPGSSRAAEWRSEQPVAPGVGVPTTIGEIGDIEFWAPNRGMLITAGNEGSPAGLFAYDGAGWYRYSTVCGGHEGRIAYAGPNDFWTISDQQAGQETGGAPPQRISLCHFVNAAVVASYAEPLGVAGSYLPMDAAACASPGDCWFGGERLPGTVNVGAFHLHWDGSAMTPIPSLTEAKPGLEDPGRSVTSIAYHQGAFYEGLVVQGGDQAPGEAESEPSLLHQIFTGGDTLSFLPLYAEPAASVGPGELEGLRLSSDGEELWAVAGAAEGSSAPILAIRLGEAGFEGVTLHDPEGVLAAGDAIGGVAAAPGSESAWVSFRQPGDSPELSKARLTRIHADGAVDPAVLLPGGSEAIGSKGPAGPIACPAADQCWTATQRGWLFHLGPDLPQDGDPLLHALVTYRPPDASLPSLPPTSLPEDNSGAYPENSNEPAAEIAEEPLPKRKPPIVSRLRRRLTAGGVLELSFVLRAKAHVQLIAKREGQVVAQTKRYTMAKGKQSLRLRLDPKRWPTKLDLRVHEVKRKKR